MLSKKIVRFLKSGFLVISIGFSMGISGCKGNTEEPVSSEPIEIVSEKGMDDNFINIPIDIYAEATTKNKLNDMETVRKVVERFGECGYAAVDCENRVDNGSRFLSCLVYPGSACFTGFTGHQSSCLVL